MKNRLKEIRSQKGLNQENFAKRLGISMSNISSYEAGRRNPSDSVIKLICKEFNVNEEWLRYGIGEMFIEISKDEEITIFLSEVLKEDKNSFKKRLISALSRMNDNGWNELENFIDEIYNSEE